jgi:glycosyltransferase involved in cell wall biosynthesis
MVTVVIPAFNAEQYIGEALESVRNQTLGDVEVFLVDDGSTDGTLLEAERFAGSLDLTIVRQGNAGPSAARNIGIRRARGRYCAFLDADDVMLPELLAAQTLFLESDPDLGFVLTDVMTFDERGIRHRRRWNFSESYVGTVLDRLLLENFVTTSSVMARTERLLEAGLFPEDRRVAEDYELWLRMAARWKVGIIARPLVRYRYCSGSLSSDKTFGARSTLVVIEAFWREHPDYLRSHPHVRRRSLARHLLNAGSAAFGQGKRSTALGYLLRSLRHDPWTASVWKSLAKTILLPSNRSTNRRLIDPSEVA